MAKCEEDIEVVESQIELLRLMRMKPIYEKRDQVLRKIPQFWQIVLSQHTDFANYIRASDFKYVDKISSIVVKYPKLNSEDLNSIQNFQIQIEFNEVPNDFPAQSVTKEFQIIKSSDPDEDDTIISEPVEIVWPTSYNSINPEKISDKKTKEGKHAYRTGMKSFFGWFKWTGKKPGKEFPHGDGLTSLLVDDIYPHCIKYYIEVQRDLEDERSDASDSSLGELELPDDEESDHKRQKI